MVTRNETVSTTVTLIVDYHKDRRSLIITNNSGATIFVSQNKANITTQGTPLPVGSSLSFSVLEGDEPQLELYAQTSGSTADIRIIEGFGGREPTPAASASGE